MDEFANIVSSAVQEAGLSETDLMTMDAFELETVMQEATKKVCPGELFFYQPIIDGHLLTKTPGELIKEGKYADADVMCGTVTGDSWMFCRKVKEQIGDNAEMLRGFAMSPFMSWAQSNIATGYKPIYTYFFERHIPGYLPGVPVPPGPKRDPSNKTPHASEIAYVFGTYENQPKQWTEYDQVLSKALMEYWTNFAKTGNPNGDKEEVWTKNTTDTPYTMNFRNDGWDMKQLPENDVQQQVIDYTIEHPGMLETWNM
jgi:para-nitrobenzyl esterase